MDGSYSNSIKIKKRERDYFAIDIDSCLINSGILSINSEKSLKKPADDAENF